MKNFSMKQVKRRVQKTLNFMSNHPGVAAISVMIISCIITTLIFVYIYNINPEYSIWFLGIEGQIDKGEYIYYAFWYAALASCFVGGGVAIYLVIIREQANKRAILLIFGGFAIFLCRNSNIEGICVGIVIAIIITSIVVSKVLREILFGWFCILLPVAIIGTIICVAALPFLGVKYIWDEGKKVLKDFKEEVLN